MTDARGILVMIPMILLVASTTHISEHCQMLKDTKIECKCTNNAEFFLPDGYNYENSTSLSLASCSSANLHFSSLTEANQLEDINVQNIRDRLIFELFLTTRKLRTLKISNVGRIPLITHDTFTSLSRINVFEIKNTVIENFEEQFNDIEVTDFTMINVTVMRIDGVNFSEKGRNLRIIDCYFRNVTTSMNFAFFSNVEIINSKFELQKPGHLSIESDFTLVQNSVFSNASINIVATTSITINKACADGKSSLRLSSSNIGSYNNKWPTEIVYTRNKLQNELEVIVNQNNTVCIAGNCKCPKKNGQTSHKPLFSYITLEIVFFILALSIF